MSTTTTPPPAPTPVIKPGTVTTISVNFDAFTSPIPLLSPADPGAKMMLVGATGEYALCFKAQQWSSGSEGNHTARWRRRLARRKSGISGRVGN